jgi:hypothetical protein
MLIPLLWLTFNTWSLYQMHGNATFKMSIIAHRQPITRVLWYLVTFGDFQVWYNTLCYTSIVILITLEFQLIKFGASNTSSSRWGDKCCLLEIPFIFKVNCIWGFTYWPLISLHTNKLWIPYLVHHVIRVSQFLFFKLFESFTKRYIQSIKLIIT